MHDVSEQAFRFSFKALQMDFLLTFNQAQIHMSWGNGYVGNIPGIIFLFGLSKPYEKQSVKNDKCGFCKD